MTDTPRYANLAQIKAANAAHGHYFFEPASMRFFDSRIEGRSVYGGRFFITSEQFRANGFPGLVDGPRRFTIREANEDGSIDTVGDFQAYATLGEAREAAKSLARVASVTPAEADAPSAAQLTARDFDDPDAETRAEHRLFREGRNAAENPR